MLAGGALSKQIQRPQHEIRPISWHPFHVAIEGICHRALWQFSEEKFVAESNCLKREQRMGQSITRT